MSKLDWFENKFEYSGKKNKICSKEWFEIGITNKWIDKYDYTIWINNLPFLSNTNIKINEYIGNLYSYQKISWLNGINYLTGHKIKIGAQTWLDFGKKNNYFYTMDFISALSNKENKESEKKWSKMAKKYKINLSLESKYKVLY